MPRKKLPQVSNEQMEKAIQALAVMVKKSIDKKKEKEKEAERRRERKREMDRKRMQQKRKKGIGTGQVVSEQDPGEGTSSSMQDRLDRYCR